MEDKKFKDGIRNAIRVCMNVESTDRVLIISDLKTLVIGQALADEANAVGAQSWVVKLEQFGKRPITELPPGLLETLINIQPTVTFYAAESQEGELKMRMAMSSSMNREFTERGFLKPRHGHMVSIGTRQIREGMTADYVEVNRLTMEVLELVKNASTIEVQSKKGTDLVATFNPSYTWIPCTGLYHEPGDWGNLPDGEVFTCPQSLDGVIVADVLGDYFSPKYGVLDSPMTIEVKDSIVQNVSCANEELAAEFVAYLDSAENGRRAGEFAIGTNTSVKELSGNMLQDEKIPGIHVAFGNPYPNQTGADWRSSVHVDVVPTNCTISVDGKTIMENGAFTV